MTLIAEKRLTMPVEVVVLEGDNLPNRLDFAAREIERAAQRATWFIGAAGYAALVARMIGPSSLGLPGVEARLVGRPLHEVAPETALWRFLKEQGADLDQPVAVAAPLWGAPLDVFLANPDARNWITHEPIIY